MASDALQAAVAVACRTLALEDAEAALRRGYQEALEWCAANGAPGPPDSLSVVYDRLSALSWRMRREVYGDDLCGSRP